MTKTNNITFIFYATASGDIGTETKWTYFGVGTKTLQERERI